MNTDPDSLEHALRSIGFEPSGRPVLAAHGWESHIYRCETSTGTVALRVHAREDPGPALHEAAVMTELADLGYPVPRVRGTTVVAGRQAIVMDFIDGPTLWDTDAATVGEPVGRACRRLLDRLHRLPVRRPDPPLAWVREGFTRAADALPAFRPFVSTLLAHQPSDVETAWCHLDFHPGNVLWAGGPWVIDWTSARATDPRFDLAWSRLLAEMYAPQWAGSFAAATSDPWFEAVMALRRLATVARMLGGSAHAAGDQLESHLAAMRVPAEWLEEGTGIAIRDVESLVRGPRHGPPA